jgi:hypothetical protein
MLSSNLYLNKYLNNYDISQKYISNNFFLIPKLEKIILEIPLNQLQNFINNIIKTKSLFIYINFYFIFYIFFSHGAYINFSKKKEKDYALKIEMHNKHEIEEFIHQFFLHIYFNTNFKYFFNLSNSTQNISNTQTLKQTKSKYEKISKKSFFFQKKFNFFLFNLKVPFLWFFKINIYLDSFFENSNSKELFTYFNFKFKNVNNSTNLFKCLTNSNGFWFLNI